MKSWISHGNDGGVQARAHSVHGPDDAAAESLPKTQLDLPLSLIAYPLHSLVDLLIVGGSGLVTSCIYVSLSPLSRLSFSGWISHGNDEGVEASAHAVHGTDDAERRSPFWGDSTLDCGSNPGSTVSLGAVAKGVGGLGFRAERVKGWEFRVQG